MQDANAVRRPQFTVPQDFVLSSTPTESGGGEDDSDTQSALFNASDVSSVNLSQRSAADSLDCASKCKCSGCNAAAVVKVEL